MVLLKFKCEDRHYELWELYNGNSLSLEDKTKYNVNPITSKLFDQDIFEYSEGASIKIIHSSMREMPTIPGVLLLENNKTYGKFKNKFYYRFIPDDKRLPVFLVPYLTKKLGFNKHLKNKYVLMKFKQWDAKHPIGQIVQIIGDVDVLGNFYEYQLYCKSLYQSIQKFNKKTLHTLRESSEEQFVDTIMETYTMEDRRDIPIYTIDPEHSTDFDDAFGLQFPVLGECVISIYIANVSIWMDVMNLWDSFSQRISTIYLPDRKRPMLPSVLSDSLCSLQQKQPRFAFTMDIHLNADCEIQSVTFCNCVIKVKRNYTYESKGLKKNPMYFELFEIITSMNKHSKYLEVIKDSHDVIAYLMICMNNLCAKELLSHKTGIFRSMKYNLSDTLSETIPSSVRKFMKMWNSTGGRYLKYDEYEAHDALKLDIYVHITSPIRRIVDLLNILQLQHYLGLIKFNKDSQSFYDKWTSDEAMEYINVSMRSIRRVQTDCELLTKCVEEPNILEQIYKGYVFDCIERSDALYQYMVYLPQLKIVRRYVSRQKFENFSEHEYTLYLFKDEDNVKQKIVVSMVSE